jgi:hypothetical protein
MHDGFEVGFGNVGSGKEIGRTRHEEPSGGVVKNKQVSDWIIRTLQPVES